MLEPRNETESINGFQLLPLIAGASAGMPTYMLWIIIGVISIVLVIVAVVISIVVYRLHAAKKRHDTEVEEADAENG
jgi:uncharacterized membrane protein